MNFLRLLSFNFIWAVVFLGASVVVPQLAGAQLLDPNTCASNLPRSIVSGKYGLSTCSLPIDEDSAIDTGVWAPWKKRPYCIEPLQSDAPAPQFCLYTFEPFRGSHGFSVVTTPVLAATIVDALDDAVVPPRLRDHPSSSLAPDARDSPAFAVENIPGKGKGLIAKRHIRKWDVILVDFPVILTHMGLFEVVGPETRQDILERALRQLPEEQQGEILSLARSSGGEPIEDTLKTNIFGVELGMEIPHLGLFQTASRMNHDCKPSAFWRYSVRNLAVEVIAMRDIEMGEEITQSYVPLGLTHNERKEGLNSWGFTCQCSLCAASKTHRDTSDYHRKRLLNIYHELNEVATGKANMTADAITQLTGEIENLVQKESLEAQLLVYYGVVARAYMKASELSAARKYVDLCEDLWVRYAGGEEDYQAGMHQLQHELKEREAKAIESEKARG
ncbi:SET domain-containing protein [Hypoxylon trugodes]|uniref:SET domain-containing protein n=1 Tax=Hypoxylon trugodes TaxID=326681 RepID=UPI00219579AA|nr:SET domain-containing protein [Hypoxylon trugodes]KAI1391850.1 SET domain-containing protein [Hypoxylon trugodes]